jgi:hypothetical protein
VKPVPPPRLHVIQAPDADVAVIFRRGPSKRVELVRWDTRRDVFERGHWFHGRIYERRSDLSPDGELLVYFASKFTGGSPDEGDYTYAWTAVSKPPWLTALALWPKGDCWHGGGLFLGRRRLLLNHKPEVANPHPKHQPPRGLAVVPNPAAHGEDEPIYSQRLDRAGWNVVQPWDVEWCTDVFRFRTNVPEVRVRLHPTLPLRITMTRRLDGFTYREHFRVDAASRRVPLPRGRLDYVDWDRRGRLIVLHSGQVLVADTGAEGVADLRPLIDLTGDRPEPRETPSHARRWRA